MSTVRSEPFWANFKYERLPTFCFLCGILGHSDKFCPKFFDNPDAEVVRPYDLFMRAPDRKVSRQICARWLRDSMANPLMADSEIGLLNKEESSGIDADTRA